MPITSPKTKLNPHDTIVIILAATKTPRMGNHGAKINITMPNNRTLLQNQLEFVYKNLPVIPSNVFVTIGYDADRAIIRRPPDIKYIENNQWQQTGETEELRLVLNCCNPEKVLIVTGDIFFGNVHIPVNYSESWTTSLNDINDLYQIGVKAEDGFLNMFSFSFDSKFLGLVNLVGDELQSFRKLITREKNKLALWELLEEYIKSGNKLKNIDITTNKIIKINTTKDVNLIRNKAGIL